MDKALMFLIPHVWEIIMTYVLIRRIEAFHVNSRKRSHVSKYYIHGSQYEIRLDLLVHDLLVFFFFSSLYLYQRFTHVPIGRYGLRAAATAASGSYH